MKTCTVCKVPKELEEFHKTSRTKDGRVSSCKQCESDRKKLKNTPESNHARYLRNRDVILDGQKEYNKKNRSQISQRMKSYYQRTKKQSLIRGWKQKGILNSEGKFFTLQDFDVMLQSQGGICKICGSKGETHKKGLCVDHNHETGMARGILCGFCNTAIAYLKEDTELVLRALKYLNND